MVQIWPQHLKTAGHKLAKVMVRLTLLESLNTSCVNSIPNVMHFKSVLYDLKCQNLGWTIQ